jgi:hypothetical protein
MAIERRRGLFGALMFAVLLFNITATTFFLHSHNIEGWEIVHSHPYSDSTAHTHTRSHILLLNNALHLEALTAESVTCCEAFFTEVYTTHEEFDAPLFERTPRLFSLRAPPAKA